jgi:hypothetical protein
VAVYHLCNDVQITFETRCVNNAHDDVGGGRSYPAEKSVRSDLLIRSTRVQTVRAGKIQDGNLLTIRQSASALSPLDGDSGIVADFVMQTGKGVEECGLAAIRIAQESDCVHPAG